MRGQVFIFYVFFICLLHAECKGQSITGEVLDMDTKAMLKDVSIENVYTRLGVLSDTDGKFVVLASKGQLLQFSKVGYKTAMVRIPEGDVPPYFKIIIKKSVTQLPADDLLAKNDYRSDSIYYHNLYKHELDFPKESGLDMIEHPFSALSKRNQEEWAFQKDYSENQKQKYVDFTFTPELITSLTGLTGDSLQFYMRRYKPTYDQLKSMGEYNFFNYIKRTVQRYRDIANAPHRNSG
jgi:hypothetical protein